MELTNWDKMENPFNYMRGYGEGIGTPARNRMLELVEDGWSFLDVGCGPGIEYENLFAANRLARVRYKGIDYSENFIKACKANFPNADFEVQNALSLQEPDKSWDLVLLRHVLEHCPGYERPIREAFRVARKLIVINMYKGLLEGLDQINCVGYNSWDCQYNKQRFLEYLSFFGFPFTYELIEHPCNRFNHLWIIELGA